MKPTTDSEERIYEKVVEENERNYQEKQRIKKEGEEQMRKERRDYHAAMKAVKLKEIQEEKDLRAWETLQLFKKIEHDKEWEADERKRAWNGKMEWAKTLKEDIVNDSHIFVQSLIQIIVKNILVSIMNKIAFIPNNQSINIIFYNCRTKGKLNIGQRKLLTSRLQN